MAKSTLKDGAILVLACNCFRMKFEATVANQKNRLSNTITWKIRHTEMFVLPDLIPIVSRVFMSGNKSPMIASAAMPHVMISKVMLSWESLLQQ